MTEDVYWKKDITVYCAGKEIRTRLGLSNNILFISQPKGEWIYLYDREFAKRSLEGDKPLEIVWVRDIDIKKLMRIVGIKCALRFDVIVRDIKLFKREHVHILSSSQENGVLALPLVLGVAFSNFGNYSMPIKFIAQQRGNKAENINVIFLG